MEALIAIVIVGAGLFFFGMFLGTQQQVSIKESEQLRDVMRRQDELQSYTDSWRREHARLISETENLRAALTAGFMQGRTWLAEAFADFINTKDTELECALVLKPNPALKAAETVSEIRRIRRGMARELKLLQYQLASYEEYFPELLEYREAILDEVVDLRAGASEALEDVDPALAFGYLSREEYDKLPTAEKYQRALDRYWARTKSNTEIGRAYERYIGQGYETKGWAVEFHGALKGFEDFGRDLICRRGSTTHIVQCKCWSSSKVIREKHIMQLFGTCILYRITESDPSATPVFITTTTLSPEAELVAKELDVVVHQVPLARYPMIKCNVNRTTGERIYHLPFDQQYDRVIIGNMPEESYVMTIAEAEAARFRRAHRWHGSEVED